MDKRTEAKNSADYIMIGVLIVNIILSFIFRITDSFGVISFVNICVIFIILSISSPINNYIKRGVISDKLVVLTIIIRCIILTIFIITLYEILLSSNYHLKYTYLVSLISFVLIISSFFLEMLIMDYKKRKLIGKKYNILYVGLSAMIIALVGGYGVFGLVNSFNHPQRHIVLDKINTPQYISIYKFGDDEFGDASSGLEQNIKIVDTEVLEIISKDIQGIEINNITSTELLNYQRMRRDNPPYYLMVFNYKDTKNKKNGLDNGYLHQLVMTSNGRCAIELASKNDRLFFSKYYNEVYPINLSKETIDMIFTYLN